MRSSWCQPVSVVEWLAHLTAKQEISPASYYYWNMHVGKVTSCFAGGINQQRCGTRGEFQEAYIIYASAKYEKGCPLSLWNPQEMSPEVWNRGISGPKMDMCPPKFIKEKK